MSFLGSFGSTLSSWGSSAYNTAMSYAPSFIGGGISSGLNAVGSFVDGAIGSYFGGKNARDSDERQLQNSKAAMNHQALLDKIFYYPANLDFYKDTNTFKSDLDYNMAQRYAENSAKWAVSGLRNAGLNPILAAGNHGQTFGSPSNGVSSSLGSKGSSIGGASVSAPRMGMPSFSDVVKTVADTDVAKSTAVNNRLQGEVLASTRDKIDSEREQINANTARTLAETDAIVKRLDIDNRRLRVDQQRADNDSLSYGFRNGFPQFNIGAGLFRRFIGLVADPQVVNPSPERDTSRDNQNSAKNPQSPLTIHHLEDLDSAIDKAIQDTKRYRDSDRPRFRSNPDLYYPVIP